MILTLLLVLYPCSSRISGQNAGLDVYNEKIANARQLFSGLEGIKAYFRTNSNPLAKTILETFENECFYMDEPELPPDNERKPFIVIEGNHRNSREVVGVRLAGMLNGRYLIHPAPCLIKYLEIIPKGTLMRRAYYVLSLYAMSFNIKVHLSLGRAVVLNGYWLDQLSFALIQSLSDAEVPSAASDVFSTPKDLLQPDIIVYLNFPDDLFFRPATTRSPLNWKRRVVAMYTALQTRYPIVVQDLKGIFRVTTDVVYQHISKRLADTRVIAPRKQRLSIDHATTVIY